MFQEKVIDGVLCFKLSDEVEFIPFSSEQLTSMLLSSRRRERANCQAEAIGKEIDPYNDPGIVVWCGDEP